MEQIDTENIIWDKRTRGTNVNWAEAEEKAKAEGNLFEDDDDEDDDEDFEDPDQEDSEMKD
jgi:hypothetical protein